MIHLPYHIITLYISGLGSDNMQNLYYTTYTTREILLAPTMSFHILLPAIGSGCHQVMGGRWWWLLLVIAGGGCQWWSLAVVVGRGQWWSLLVSVSDRGLK